MNTPPHSITLSHSLLNVLLVIVEAGFALVLRLDSKLRRAVYPLVKRQTLLCVRTYLPHTQIYVSFSYKGLLLDSKAPSDREPSVVLNAYTHEIIQAIFSQNETQIDALQMRGQSEDIALIKNFLHQLGVGHFIQNLLTKYKKSPDSDAEQSNTKTTETKLTELKAQLNEKTQQITQLQIDKQKQQTELAEYQSKCKILLLAVIFSVLVAMIFACLFFFTQ